MLRGWALVTLKQGFTKPGLTPSKHSSSVCFYGPADQAEGNSDRQKSAMDGWIQNNWLEAAVAWWLMAEMSQDRATDCLPPLACRFTRNKIEKWCLRNHHQESDLLFQQLSVSISHKLMLCLL